EREYGSMIAGVKPIGPPARGGPGPQLIKKEYIGERFRLAWELRLLAAPAAGERPVRALISGPVDEVPDVSMPPTFEALRRIKNDKSVLALGFYFRHTCRDDKGPELPNSENVLLTLEGSFPTAAGAKAILDCAEWCELQQGRVFPPRQFVRQI